TGLRGRVRNQDAGERGVRSVKNCYVPDSMHERTGRALRKVGKQRVADYTVAASGRLHLDQLMVVKGPRGLCCHGVGQASIAEADKRLELVSQTPQVTPLPLRQRRGRLRRRRAGCPLRGRPGTAGRAAYELPHVGIVNGTL